MKRMLLLFAIIFASMAHGYQVCGPIVENTDYAYSHIIASDSVLLGYWANGNNCTSDTDVYDISQMCTTVVAGGEAFCSKAYGLYPTTPFDASAHDYGTFCRCRRTKMLVDGKLIDSIGQWVLVGALSNCAQNCARVCADNVSNNTNYMRRAIMVLPSLI